MTVLIPDGEKLLVRYLTDHAAVQALGVRVVGTTPRDPDSDPWVRVTQLDARQNEDDPADHLIEFYFQLDCYASKAGLDGSQQKEASLITRTVRGALGDIRHATHEGAVITGQQVNGAARIPDRDLEPARERFALTLTVWAHAA